MGTFLELKSLDFPCAKVYIRKVHRGGHDFFPKFHEFLRRGWDGHWAGSLLWSPKHGGVPFGQSRGALREGSGIVFPTSQL